MAYGLIISMQAFYKLQDELKLRSEELHGAEETINRLRDEKLLLEQRVSGLEKKKADEVTTSTQE